MATATATLLAVTAAVGDVVRLVANVGTEQQVAYGHVLSLSPKLEEYLGTHGEPQLTVAYLDDDPGIGATRAGWHAAFNRHVIKHKTHPDVVSGKESVYYIDVLPEPGEAIDMPALTNVPANPSVAALGKRADLDRGPVPLLGIDPAPVKESTAPATATEQTETETGQTTAETTAAKSAADLQVTATIPQEAVDSLKGEGHTVVDNGDGTVLVTHKDDTTGASTFKAAVTPTEPVAEAKGTTEPPAETATKEPATTEAATAAEEHTASASEVEHVEVAPAATEEHTATEEPKASTEAAPAITEEHHE